MSIRTKLLGGGGAALLVIVLFGVYLLGTLAITSRSLRELEQRFEVLRLLSGLEADGQALVSAVRAVIGTRDRSWEETYDAKSSAVNRQLDQLGQLVTDPDSRRALAEYEQIVHELAGAELLIVARAAEGNTERATELFRTVYEERYARASLVLSEAVAREREQVELIIGRSDRLLRSVQLLFWTTMAVVFIGAASLLMVLTRHLTLSIKRLLAAAQAISSGDLSRRVVVRSGDELGRLGEHFNRMAHSLQQMLQARERQSKQLLVQNYELEQTKVRLEEAVKHLQAIDAAKSDFVSVAAHQLRTPLTGVKWTLHALSQEAAGLTSAQARLVQDAAEACDRLVALVNDLLNVARLEEGRLGLERVRQSLTPLIADARRRVGAAARGKSIRLVVRLPGEPLPAVDVDRVRLVTVLDNLLDNAIKYTPPGGTVTLEARVSDREVTVQVTDTGIGIPRDEWSRVFTKFFRSENAQLSKTSGTGLGLFVAKKVIEQHDGRMWFHSVENEGSSFAFALPRADRTG